jgi:hypothetical protein
MASLVEAAEEDSSGRTAYMGLHRRLSSLYNVLQGSDGIPTTQAVSAVREALEELEIMLGGAGNAPSFSEEPLRQASRHFE